MSDGIGLHWEALWQCLKCRPFLIKPNLSELGALFGVDDLDYLEGVELAAQVQREGARNVLVSMGPGGAFLLTEDQRLYLAPACGGQARSTVGAGDAWWRGSSPACGRRRILFRPFSWG